MGDRNGLSPPDTLYRYSLSGGINSFIPPDSPRTDTLFRDTGADIVHLQSRSNNDSFDVVSIRSNSSILYGHKLNNINNYYVTKYMHTPFHSLMINDELNFF